jgi:thiol-disulfide isomerase/thioredoxin
MKTIILLTLLATISVTSFSQPQLIIHGKIDLPRKSRNVRISGYKDVPINPDGTFEMKSELKYPGIAFIMTDSSSPSNIWLEEGEYTIHCREVKSERIGGQTTFFGITLLKGPVGAELYNDFKVQQMSSFGVQDQAGENQNTIKERRKNRVIEYLDSVIRTNNTSEALANMLRSSQLYIGDEVTNAFIQKLSPELRKTDDIAMLENSFKRKEKIGKEKVFENFILVDMLGKDFNLASVSGKKAVLIDFWNSSCGPCRAQHPRLKEWYKKYADKGLEIISVSIDDDKTAWLKAVKSDGIENWINVCDFKGWEADLVKNYYIPYIPFRFLLDEKKNIVLVDNMQDSWITEKDIAALLNK